VLGPHGGKLICGETSCLRLTRSDLRADPGPGALHRLSGAEVLSERLLEDLVLKLSGACRLHLGRPQELLVDVDGGLLPS